jgi:hypothetical protein
MAMTLAIAGRMLLIRKRVVSTIGEEHAKLYTSVASMFIESGAVYSIVGLIFIISYGRQSNVQNLVFPSLEQAIVSHTCRHYKFSTDIICHFNQCIASELIMLRIALGRAWTAEVSAKTSADPNRSPSQTQSIIFHVPTDLRSNVTSNRDGGMVSFIHTAHDSDSFINMERGEKPEVL